jgi:hypothetical protein
MAWTRDELSTVEEAADVLGVSVQRMYNLRTRLGGADRRFSGIRMKLLISTRGAIRLRQVLLEWLRSVARQHNSRIRDLPHR